MNKLKPVFIFETGGRRRSGLYADIPVPVPAGEEGGPGGLPNLLKEEEKEKDEEEKKEDDDEEEEMEGKRRDEEDMPNIIYYGASSGTRSPATCQPALFARTVQPLWQELLQKV